MKFILKMTEFCSALEMDSKLKALKAHQAQQKAVRHSAPFSGDFSPFFPFSGEFSTHVWTIFTHYRHILRAHLGYVSLIIEAFWACSTGSPQPCFKTDQIQTRIDRTWWISNSKMWCFWTSFGRFAGEAGLDLGWLLSSARDAASETGVIFKSAPIQFWWIQTRFWPVCLALSGSS